MDKSFFNKKHQKKCAYCVHGSRLSFENEIICKKHGVTKEDDCCKSYKYDPLKRVPVRVKIADGYNEDDFKL